MKQTKLFLVAIIKLYLVEMGTMLSTLHLIVVLIKLSVEMVMMSFSSAQAIAFLASMTMINSLSAQVAETLSQVIEAQINLLLLMA